MNYLIARQAYLKALGHPTGEDRLRAMKAFDRTPAAWMAQSMDFWANAWSNFFKLKR